MDYLLLGGGVLVVRVGMMIHDSGLARSKNAAATMVRAVLGLAVAVLAFWLVGAALMNMQSGLLAGWNDAQPDRTLAQLALAALCCGIALGGGAERARMAPLLLMAAVVGAVVMPLLGQWTTRGWLGSVGVVDFAAAGYVHLAGACVALSLALMVGPRAGKYNRDGSANAIPGHSLPLLMIGMLVMLLGFLPYLMSTGAAPLAVGVNLLVAVSGGGLAAAGLSHWRYGKIDAPLLSAAMVGAMVAMTPAAGLLSSPAALLVGAVAGLIVPVTVLLFDLWANIDDAGSAAAVHGVSAAWGLVAAGILLPGGFVERLERVGVQFLAVMVVTLLSLGVSLGVLWLAGRVMKLRVSEQAEYDGLDLSEHDVNAYADFHQTMIKSYHLREA